MTKAKTSEMTTNNPSSAQTTNNIPRNDDEALIRAAGDGYEGLVTRGPDGDYQMSYLVSGVHCAVCIQKIEAALSGRDEVQNARLNFSTGRLNVSWTAPDDSDDNGRARANDYAAIVADLGYGVAPYNPDIEKQTAENENRFLLMCMGIAGFAMGNIMLLSVGLWVTTGEEMGENTRALLHWVSALIAIPAIAFAGRPFFRSAWTVLKQKHTNMDVPISLALILATGMSVHEALRGGEHVYFDSAVMLMFFLLVGRYLDFRARRSAKTAATDLMQTLSGFANVVDDENGRTKRILIRDLREGMRVRVAAGEDIPTDGVVDEGRSSLDTSLVTGETLPREVAGGDAVYAGTLNLDGPLIVAVEKAAEDSLLADVVRLMEQAEQGQSAYVRLADRAAKLYTPFVHTLAALAFGMWWILLGAAWQDALMIAVTVLIITCPCALGLAVPVVQVLASGELMKRGVLVKSGDALERLAEIDMALFDKTGTLTRGKPSLQGAYSDEDLALAAALGGHSAHPLSKAIVQAAEGMYLPSVADVKEHAGKGVEASAEIEGKRTRVRIGSRSWCGAADVDDAVDAPEIWLDVAGRTPVRFVFEDPLRRDAADVISAFKAADVECILISGDRAAAVQKMAAAAGIDDARASLTPPEKYDILDGFKAEGHKPMMVGDGLNDAPVLAAAHISMAPGSAIDMAQNAADVVFMGDDLAPVSNTWRAARFTQKLVKENFGLAIAYNVVAVPMAFAGLVTPMVAAIAMSGSSLLVIMNSFRLKWMLKKDVA